MPENKKNQPFVINLDYVIKVVGKEKPFDYEKISETIKSDISNFVSEGGREVKIQKGDYGIHDLARNEILEAITPYIIKHGLILHSYKKTDYEKVNSMVGGKLKPINSGYIFQPV